MIDRSVLDGYIGEYKRSSDYLHLYTPTLRIVRPVGSVGTADRRNSSLRNAPPGWDRPHFPHSLSKLITRQVLRHLTSSHCFLTDSQISGWDL
ncbi:unnamed protein product [Nezara viridula]|uniref:Uncharacterized protein n=1 Tax=Nezara viridula TaxID=85310 RepID=A0A9P0E854_NEZVI|nr:unnamed protein product [Nezara viridula]